LKNLFRWKARKSPGELRVKPREYIELEKQQSDDDERLQKRGSNVQTTFEV